MRSPNSRRQRTIVRDGRKVRIVSRRITRRANFQGYKVTVSLPGHFYPAIDYRFFVPERDAAEEMAVSRYLEGVRSHPTP